MGLLPLEVVGVKSSLPPVITQNETFAHCHWILSICQLCSSSTLYLCSNKDIIHPSLFVLFNRVIHPVLPRTATSLLMCRYKIFSKWTTNPRFCICNRHHQSISHQAATTNRSDEATQNLVYSPSMTQANRSF